MRLSAPTVTRVVWLTLSLTFALTAIGMVLLVATWSTPNPASYGIPGLTSSFAVVFGVLGALIATRRPDNRIGWMFLAVAFLASVQYVFERYALWGFFVREQLPPGALFVAWFQSWTWVPLITLVGPMTFLHFPSGKLTSSRSRWVVAITLLGMVFACFGIALAPGGLDNLELIENPYGLENQKSLIGMAEIGGILVVITGTGLAAGSLIQRLRRATGIERQQLKWLAYTGALGVASLAIYIPVELVIHIRWIVKLLEVIQITAFLGIPVAIGTAILRYRLFEIDRIINRTLVYAGVTATLGAVYVASILLLQALIEPLVPGSGLTIALSTLGAAALFHPVRRRVQQVVDQRFYRRRYDAARTVDAFSVHVRNEVDLESLTQELLAVVSATLQPTHASLWLRAHGQRYTRD